MEIFKIQVNIVLGVAFGVLICLFSLHAFTVYQFKRDLTLLIGQVSANSRDVGGIIEYLKSKQ
jgi:hypothetical protein